MSTQRGGVQSEEQDFLWGRILASPSFPLENSMGIIFCWCLPQTLFKPTETMWEVRANSTVNAHLCHWWGLFTDACCARLKLASLRKTSRRATVLEQLTHQCRKQYAYCCLKKASVSFLFFASELPDLSAIRPQPIRAFVSGVWLVGWPPCRLWVRGSVWVWSGISYKDSWPSLPPCPGKTHSHTHAHTHGSHKPMCMPLN